MSLPFFFEKYILRSTLILLISLNEHVLTLFILPAEARAGQAFPLGRNNDIKVIRLTLDKVKVHGRPLALYCFVWLAQKLVITNSKRYGFVESITGGCRYLIRVPKGWKPDKNGPETTVCIILLFELPSLTDRILETTFIYSRIRNGNGTIRYSSLSFQHSTRITRSTSLHTPPTLDFNVVFFERLSQPSKSTILHG